MASSLGKVPITFVRGLISLFSRSSGLVECSWFQWSFGKAIISRISEGQHATLVRLAEIYGLDLAELPALRRRWHLSIAGRN